MSKAKLLKGLIVNDSESAINGKIVDVIVTQQGAEIVPHGSRTGEFEVLDYSQCLLTNAFTDLSFSLPDPGFEERENFESAENLALASGFTRLCCLPNTLPVIQSKSEVKYFIKNSQHAKVDFLPLGAISKDLKGEEMAELFDMNSAGAIAFSNADKPLSQAGLLLRALQYVQTFDGLVMVFPFDQSLAIGGVVHEGKVSVSLGLKGMPAISEFLMIKRDLEVLRYTGGRLHFTGISSAESVDIIRKAKAEGLKVTCDVRAMNLLFDDNAIKDFDSNFKLTPPLRSAEHQAALIAGLKDGTIDAISSGHRPLNIELKDVEFLYAKTGASTLQSVWSKLVEKLQPEITVDKIATLLSSNIEKILRLPESQIKEGQVGNFVVTRTNTKWQLNKKSNRSLSLNSPFMNTEHAHKIEAVFSKNNFIKHN